MTAYFNEFDPKAAAWLRELIRADVLIPGDVDERDIRDVTAGDLDGYTQCHFFAGIGGWPYALRLAGWPDDRPVWTGSCPCQPFSAAGKRAGFADERHLWPHFYRLIGECRPPVIFGEQVASPAGMQWLDVVLLDLENAHYAVGAADLCAASIGAPHIRQRLFWVAESGGQRCQGLGLHLQPGSTRLDQFEVGRSGEVDLAVGDAGRTRLSQRIRDGRFQREAVDSLAGQAPLGASHPLGLGISPGSGCEWFGATPTHRQPVQAGQNELAEPQGEQSHGSGYSGGGWGEPADDRVARDVAHAHGESRGQGGAQSGRWDTRGDEESRSGSGGRELPGELGHPDGGRSRRDGGTIPREESSPGWEVRRVADEPESAGTDDRDFWSDCEWLPCRDGKARPAQRGLQPLVTRLSGDFRRVRDPGESFDPNYSTEARVMRLRGYGNSIVPRLAVEFIRAYRDTLGD